MTYIKNDWKGLPSLETPINEPRLDHLETQYDEAVAYFDYQKNKPNGVATLDAFGRIISGYDAPLAIQSPTVIDMRNWNVVGDGVTNNLPMHTAAVNSLITAGITSAIMQYPAGKFLMAGSMTNQGLSLWLDLRTSGPATIIQGAAATVISFSGSMETAYNVSSIEKVVSGAVLAPTVHKLNFPAGTAPAYNVGDLIKIVADDIISHSRYYPAAPELDPATGALYGQAREGQYARVYLADSNSITLTAVLFGDYTTNIRVARLKPVSGGVIGGFIDTLDSAFDNSGPTGAPWRAALVNFQSMYSPTIKGTEIIRGSSTGIRFVNCYKPSTDRDFIANNLVSNDATQQLGYGVFDISCFMGQYEGTASQVRHFYTDDTQRIQAANADLAPYGCSIYGVLDGATQQGSKGAGIVTHSCARFITIRGCKVMDSMGTAYSFRGIYGTLIDSEAINCGQPVQIYSDERGSVTYGWNIENNRFYGCADGKAAISISNNAGNNTAPNYGVQQTKRVATLRGNHIEGAMQALAVTNAYVTIAGAFEFIAPAVINDALPTMRVTNSRVLTDPGIKFNMRGNNTGASQRLIEVSNANSILIMNSPIIMNTTSWNSRLTASALVNYADSPQVIIKDAVLDSWSAKSIAYASDLNITAMESWRVIDGTNSSAITMRDSGNVSTAYTVGRYLDDVQTISVVSTVNSPSTLGALNGVPAGDGKYVRVIYTNLHVSGASQTLTINHGLAYGTEMPSGVPLNITSGQSVLFINSAVQTAAGPPIVRTPVWRPVSLPAALTDNVSVTATWNPGTITANTTVKTDVAFTGAAFGDIFEVSFTTPLVTGVVMATAQTINTGNVRVQITNTTTASVTVASGTLKIRRVR